MEGADVADREIRPDLLTRADLPGLPVMTGLSDLPGLLGFRESEDRAIVFPASRDTKASPWLSARCREKSYMVGCSKNMVGMSSSRYFSLSVLASSVSEIESNPNSSH